MFSDLSLDGTLALLRQGDFQQNKSFDLIVLTGDRSGQFAQVDTGRDNFTVDCQQNPGGGVDIKT